MASNSSSAPSSSSAPTASVAMADEFASNPFFLPANENPSLILTSQPLTGLENYTTWVRSVFLALSSRNKFGFVNGSISKPDPTSPLFNSWNRCNTTILSWLTNSLSSDLKASVIYINSAKDLWIDLKKRLSQDNTPRLFELQKEISHLVQGSMSVSSYFTKFKTLWDEFVNNQPFTICNCPCASDSKSSQLDAQHKEHAFRFLMGLNDSYGTLIGQILLIEHFLPLNKMCSLVLQEEKRRSIGNTINVIQQIQQLNPVAMYVNGPRPFKALKVMLETMEERVQCEQLLNYLKAYNASASSFGTPNGPSAQTTSQVASVMAPTLPCTLATSASSFSSNFSVIDRQCFKSNSWIIDTRVIDHMVHSVSQLNTITSAVHSCVYLPNGDKAIDLAQWSMIGLCKESNGLYLFQAAVSSLNAAALATTISHISSSDLWHSRLGHPSLAKLQLLKPFVNIDITNKASCCDVCHFAKQERLSFPSSIHVTTTPFELIHYDLWGPFSIPTVDGYRHKFAPRTRKCVFLGYPHGIKGYKVLDLQSNSIYVSRDIVFYESIFPYTECPPFSTSILDTFVFPHTSSSDIDSDLVLCHSSSSPPEPIHVNPISSHDNVSAEPLSVDSIFVDPIVNTDSQSTPVLSSSINLAPFRRSTRSHKPPSYLFDYSCQFASTKPSSSMPYALSDHLNYSHLGPSFHSFVMVVSSTPSEPVSFQQAVQFPE
ncbi:uncharacterized protein LOC142620692 [Castanea sativa]|uniref:uncharacterized protein LOC142620692 n=1 Tax=Castanea sativa TaxID=21020 RepID=UPI003F651C9F